MGPPVFHLADPRIPIMRIHPRPVASFLLPLTIQSGQIFARGSLYPGLPRQPLQELLITFPAISAHNGAQSGIRFQSRGVNADLLAFEQTRFRQHFQHPSEYLPVRFQIDQPAGPRDGGVVRRSLVPTDGKEAPQRERVLRSPSNSAFTVDPLEITNQQQPEVNPRHQPGAASFSRIEAPAPVFYKTVEIMFLQNLVQALIEGMTRRPGQLRDRNPQILCSFSPLPGTHRQ